MSPKGATYIVHFPEKKELPTLEDLRRELSIGLEKLEQLKQSMLRDPTNKFIDETMFELGDKLQVLQLRIDLIEYYLKEAL